MPLNAAFTSIELPLLGSYLMDAVRLADSVGHDVQYFGLKLSEKCVWVSISKHDGGGLCEKADIKLSCKKHSARRTRCPTWRFASRIW